MYYLPIFQDSGYDGYCPADKSITSIGSSSTASSTEDASTSAHSLDAAPESHYEEGDALDAVADAAGAVVVVAVAVVGGLGLGDAVMLLSPLLVLTFTASAACFLM